MKQIDSHLILLWLIWGWLFNPCSFVLAQPHKLPAPAFITDRQGLPQAFVPSIVQDQKGFIWMATRDGLARYDGSQFKVFQPDPNRRPSLSFAGITKLKVDPNGKIWIASERQDLDVFDPVTEQFTNFSQQPAFVKLFGKNGIGDFCFDRRGERLWVVRSNTGLVSFNLRTQKATLFRHQPNQPNSLSSDVIGFVQSTPEDDLWVFTSKGIDYFDHRSQSFLRHVYQPGKASWMPEAYLNGLYLRPNGDLVVAFHHHITVFETATHQARSYPIPPLENELFNTYFAADQKGTIYFARDNKLFCFTDAEGPRLLRSGNENGPINYRSIFIDQSNVLWLGTAGNGIQKYDLRLSPFQTATYQTGFVKDLLNNGWLSLPPDQIPPLDPSLSNYNFRHTFDGQGRLWYNVGSSDLYRVDLKTRKSEKIPFPVRFKNIAIGERLCPLTTDRQGQVWAFLDSTAYRYDESPGRWTRFPYAIRKTTLMFTVDDQALWLATPSEGLVRVDRKTGRLTSYKNDPDNPNSLSSNNLLCLATDPDRPDRLWIGTFGSGACLFDKKTGLSQRLSVANGLPNNVIYSVIPDQKGQVWVGTNKGICKIQRRTLATQTYTTEDGILADEFNRYHFLHLPNDRILMGGLEGITAFYPGHIRPDSFQPATEITTLSINNKPVVPGPDSPLGELPVQAIHELRLPDNQNFLTIGFAALQFNKPDKNRYRYQLVGLEPTWVESQRPEAVFTDLRPGTYTLRLNATNLTGVWSPKIRTLRIVIHPPWWATWWAYTFYTIAGVGIAYGLFRNYVNRLKMQQSIALKEHEAAKLRELDEMKTRFFANVTHEFRTPLTLILSPAEQLLQQPLEPGIQRRVSIMETQARHLLRLINQLMDFSKLEANLMTVNESLGDIGQCVDQWLLPFREQASALGIDLVFENALRSHYWFDSDKLEPIVYNLVSNALKFTPEGGQVRVQIHPLQGTQQEVELVVSDTGIGIPPASLPLIFDRYYQVEARPESPPNRPLGTGIGLSLVKELVESQQGQITVESREGLGTLFRVWLPVRMAQPTEKGRLADEGQLIPSNENGKDEPVRILVVEDHVELAQFITESLSAGYEVDQARNGQEGLNLALERMPDVVISDVMMPVMDGYTLCNHLKSDLRTHHIPVVLLTAKVAYADRIEGLTRGADEYLTKPFHVQELQLRVRNLLENQRRLREQLQAGLTHPAPPQPVQAPVSVDPLLAGITQLIETNLDNTAFRVEDIEKYTNLSRMSLYRKMKAVTGVTPGDFIRVHRLKRSVQLLEEGRAVSETAYLVGFDSPAHFTKMFRQHYQVTPREYQAKVKLD
jgi:signal transduction histidine kinase/DNA-binding response OmpR family regulator/ligand-binding sensor domain-containing protein